MKILYSNLSFGRALDAIQDSPKSFGMRLPKWSRDVVIKCQIPEEDSKMTAPYLYVESRYGRVPWKETMIEMFSRDWQIVKIEPEETADDEEVIDSDKVKELKKDVVNIVEQYNKSNFCDMFINAISNILDIPEELLSITSDPDDEDKIIIEKVDKIHKVSNPDDCNDPINGENKKSEFAKCVEKETKDNIKHKEDVKRHSKCSGCDKCKNKRLHERDKYEEISNKMLNNDSVSALAYAAFLASHLW